MSAGGKLVVAARSIDMRMSGCGGTWKSPEPQPATSASAKAKRNICASYAAAYFSDRGFF
jgi:hypothetical protein